MVWALQDKKKLDNQLKRQPNSPMKYANEIQYGFKIRCVAARVSFLRKGLLLSSSASA